MELRFGLGLGLGLETEMEVGRWAFFGRFPSVVNS